MFLLAVVGYHFARSSSESSVNYIPDILIRHSGFAVVWGRFRFVLFVVGLLTAGIFTHYIAQGIFKSNL